MTRIWPILETFPFKGISVLGLSLAFFFFTFLWDRLIQAPTALGRPHQEKQAFIKNKVFLKNKVTKVQWQVCHAEELLKLRFGRPVREVWVPTWRGFAMRSWWSWWRMSRLTELMCGGWYNHEHPTLVLDLCCFLQTFACLLWTQVCPTSSTLWLRLHLAEDCRCYF